MGTATSRHKKDVGRIDSGEGRGVRMDDVIDDEETLIQSPEDFEDYEEFSGEADASPDDRRRDPLRRNW